MARNRNRLQDRDVPVDDVVVLENSTFEPVRLRAVGASVLAVPRDRAHGFGAAWRQYGG